MAQSSIIIAIFARGREIGYVRLDNGQLVRYGVKTIKGTRRGSTFTRRVEHTLSSVLNTGDTPAMIVLERKRARIAYGSLYQTITTLAGRWTGQGYRVRFLSLDEVKHDICGDNQAMHRELSEAIVKRYPLLWPLIHSTMAQKAKYWTNVYLALALAEAAQQKSA